MPAVLRMGRIGVLAWTLALAACTITPIDHARLPPADWPRLAETVEIRTGLSDVCRISGFHLGTNVGCAVLDFEAGTCHIYLDARYLSGEALMHEKMHCKGYDHPGEAVVRQGWEDHKIRMAARRASAVSLANAGTTPEARSAPMN
jgi:hypothetical protein